MMAWFITLLIVVLQSYDFFLYLQINVREIKSKSVIVFDIHFFADVEVIVESVIIGIDDLHVTIGRRNLQGVQ